MSNAVVLRVTDVAVTLRLGVPEDERARAQTVFVSVALSRPAPKPFSPASRIGETLDYDRLIHFIRDGLPSRGPFLLVEAVAEAVAAHALDIAGPGASAEVTVRKPSVLKAPAEVSVTLRREAAP